MSAAVGAAWPAEGRHEAQLALAGALRAEGWPEAEALEFLCAVCRAAGDEDRSKRQKTIKHTWAKPEGEPITGWTRLKSHIDPVLVDATRASLTPHADWTERVERRVAEVQARRVAETPAEMLTATASPRSFMVVSAADLAKPVPPVPYAMRHFGIAPGRPTLLAGYGGSGKTIIVQCLALHMAAGLEKCWGLPIAKGSVLHVDYEMTLDPIKRRYQRLALAYGVDLASCALEAISMPEIYLSDRDAEQALARVCMGKLVVVVDNLAAAIATSLSKENESAVRRYLDILTRVSSKTGCAFIVLVHERKKSKDDPGGLQRVRGSSAITDAAGSVISVSVAEGDGVITASQTKTSLRRKGDEVTLKIEDVGYDGTFLGMLPDEDAPGLRVVALAEKPVSEQSKANQADIKALLVKGPVENKRLIHKKLGKKNDTLNADVDALVVRREVVFVKGKGYIVDDPMQREARIAAAAGACRTPTQLAKAACVDEGVVMDLLAAGRLYRSGSAFILIEPRPEVA
jgi:hypothetical protein